MRNKKDFESPDTMKEVRFQVSIWHMDQLRQFADENGLTMSGLMRFMINQSIQTGFKFLKEKLND